MSRFASLTATLLVLLVGSIISSAGATYGRAASLASRGVTPPSDAADHLSDFNGDGYADLAIGVPKEDLGEINNAGAVNVLYGSATEPNVLSSAEDQKWTQDSDGVREMAEEGDQFGWALAYGDFNGDRFDDLAIGIKGEHVGEDSGAGAVSVLHGSADGLTAEGDQYITQNTTAIDDTAEKDDNFGYALVAFNFGNSCGAATGHDDLAIGVRNEDLGPSKEDAGAVHVIYSNKQGLDEDCNDFWTQDSGGDEFPIKGVAEADDRFGSSLAAGQFTEGGGLAIGVPGEDLGTATDAGGVNEINAIAGHLASINNGFWSQNAGEVTDDAETDDLFGSALATFSCSPFSNSCLAIGVPGEDAAEGAVHVLTADDGGVSDDPQFFLTQVGTEEAGAEFGFGLAAGEQRGSSDVPILAIGAPGDDVGGAIDAGSVTLQYWSAGDPANAVMWTQDSIDIEDAAEEGDRFGSALMLAETTGTYLAMLAIGVPEEDVGSVVDGGGVNVMYGDSADIDASDNQFWTQDSEGVNDSAEANDSLGDAVA